MKYAVFSPKNKLICFDHSDQVTEYCLEKDSEALNEYCKERGYNYQDLSPTEVGQLYTEIGATYGGCRIFKTRTVLDTMKENAVEEEFINKANELFNSRELHEEIDCPGFLEDFLMELTPLTPAELSDGVYFMENIDAPNDVVDRG